MKLRITRTSIPVALRDTYLSVVMSKQESVQFLSTSEETQFIHDFRNDSNRADGRW